MPSDRLLMLLLLRSLKCRCFISTRRTSISRNGFSKEQIHEKNYPLPNMRIETFPSNKVYLNNKAAVTTTERRILSHRIRIILLHANRQPWTLSVIFASKLILSTAKAARSQLQSCALNLTRFAKHHFLPNEQMNRGNLVKFIGSFFDKLPLTIAITWQHYGTLSVGGQ